MSFTVDDRILALAGMAQALQQVRRVAETGQSDNRVVRTAMDSVLRIDAPSVPAVYGGREALGNGLRLLHNQLSGDNADKALGKLSLSVLQVERRFAGSTDTIDKVRQGLLRLQRLAQMNDDAAHADVLLATGNLYAETISQLRPRIMVQGNPHYLGQAGVVAEIRALLLAALRSAHLWRQTGGSYLDFLLYRKRLLDAVQSALG